MSNRPHVLSVCSDTMLAQTRHEVLATQFEVVTVSTVAQIRTLPISVAIDAVLLCHSLTAKECLEAESSVRRRWQSAPILALTAYRQTCVGTDPNYTIAGLDGPRALIAAIRELVAATRPDTLPASNPSTVASSLLRGTKWNQAERPLASERTEFGKQ